MEVDKSDIPIENMEVEKTRERDEFMTVAETAGVKRPSTESKEQILKERREERNL